MRQVYVNTISTALGRIKFAGVLDKSVSLSFESMRVFGSYAVVYLLEGSGLYFDANRFRRELSRGDLVLIFPELAHSYGPRPGEKWKELYVVFEGPSFDLWRECGLLSSRLPVLRLEAVEEWTLRIGFMLDPTFRQGSDAADHLKDLCRLLSVLTEAQVAGGIAPTEERTESWLELAKNALSSDLDQPLRAVAVAQQLGLKPDGFRKRFRAEAGMGPANFRALKRIEAAKGLIKHSHMTNGEIAERLGFCDAFHFTKRFKQLTGVSPKEFRRDIPSQ